MGFAVNLTTPETSTNFTNQSTSSLNIVLFTIGIVFGFPTHSYVIWLIVTGPSGVASEFFLLNLSVCEIGNSLNGLITALSIFFPGLLKLSDFLQGLGITGRPLFQCLMCVERYLAVVHPVSFLKYKPLRYKVICCLVAWIITFSSCLVFMIILVFKTVAYPWLFSIQFLVFLCIQFFCLGAVLRALKQSGPGERKRERKEENNMKRKAFYLILLTTANMAVMYVPLILTGFIHIMMHKNVASLWIIALFCYVLADFLQPLLYLHRTGKLFCFSWL